MKLKHLRPFLLLIISSILISKSLSGNTYRNDSLSFFTINQYHKPSYLSLDKSKTNRNQFFKNISLSNNSQSNYPRIRAQKLKTSDSSELPSSGFDFINGGWLGVNFMSHDYTDKRQFKYSVFSVNLDAGLGYYYIRNRGSFWHPDWTIYGGGIGLEFAYPISDQKSYLDSILSTSYRYYLINLKGDFTKGFRALGTRFSGHISAGLSTDIVSHYARIGIGTGYQNLVLGVEYFASLTPNSRYNVFRFNWYLKYILGRNRAMTR